MRGFTADTARSLTATATGADCKRAALKRGVLRKLARQKAGRRQVRVSACLHEGRCNGVDLVNADEWLQNVQVLRRSQHLRQSY